MKMKINKKDLEKSELKGNFLYEENGEYYFNDTMNNAMFREDFLTKSKDKIFTFKEYLGKFLKVCCLVKNKPSLIFINIWDEAFNRVLKENGAEYTPVDITLESSGEIKKEEKRHKLASVYDAIKLFEKENCITYTHNEEIFKRLICEFCSRENIQNGRKIIFIFDQPENFKNLRKFDYKEFKTFPLDVVTTISRSKNMFFIFNIADRKKFLDVFGEFNAECVENSCLTNFLCKNGTVSTILPDVHSVADFLQTNDKDDVKDDRPSYEGYLKEKQDYEIDLIPSNKKSLSELEKVIPNAPYDLKEWFEKFDGGKINDFVFFTTQKDKNITLLKDANSKTYIKENCLSDEYYYLGKWEHWDTTFYNDLDCYLCLDKRWEDFSKFDKERRFNFFFVNNSEKNEGYKGYINDLKLDFYEVLDWFHKDKED